MIGYRFHWRFTGLGTTEGIGKLCLMTVTEQSRSAVEVYRCRLFM